MKHTPLTQAQQLIASDMQKVDQYLLRVTASQAPLVPIVSHYIIAAGGKRLRPMLTLLSGKLCQINHDQHVAFAAAVECIHTATLLHDDVVDESHLRRNIPTANDQFGNKTSILVGDFLLSQALQIMVREGSLQALGILSAASGVIAEGEVMQLTATHDIGLSEEQYLAIIQAKTAELFAAATELGAVAAKAGDKEANALRNYGMALGMAFQMVDDALDYSAKQEELGKTIGDDFREGKVTLPVLLAIEAANDDEKQFWQRVIADHEQEEGDLENALSLIASHNTLERTMQHARSYEEAAIAALTDFPASELRDTLIALARFAVDRPY